VRDVVENGLFLGGFPFATYSSVELPLKAGDRLCSTPIEFRKRSTRGSRIWHRLFLKQFLAAEQSTSADHFAGQLLEELSRWSARGSAKDLGHGITIVAIHAKQ
jgi:sigma-B regulation protein RsbU (phosphoserine phosphatase)